MSNNVDIAYRKPYEVSFVKFNGLNIDQVAELVGDLGQIEKGPHKTYKLDGVTIPDPGYIVKHSGGKLDLLTTSAFTEKYETSIENISDGYHSFKELYEFRMIYNALAFTLAYQSGDLVGVQKSRRHHDGEPCFGGGWFVVFAETAYGQITNHYEEKYWDLFQIPETEKITVEFDNHTSEEVLFRIQKTIQNYMYMNAFQKGFGGTITDQEFPKLDASLYVKAAKKIAGIGNLVDDYHNVKAANGKITSLDMIYFQKITSELININNSVKNLTNEK